jgi:hypothetical protein
LPELFEGICAEGACAAAITLLSAPKADGKPLIGKPTSASNRKKIDGLLDGLLDSLIDDLVDELLLKT